MTQVEQDILAAIDRHGGEMPIGEAAFGNIYPPAIRPAHSPGPGGRQERRQGQHGTDSHQGEGREP